MTTTPATDNPGPAAAPSRKEMREFAATIGRLASDTLRDSGLTVVQAAELTALRNKVARIELLADSLTEHSLSTNPLARPLADLLRAALVVTETGAPAPRPIPYDDALAGSDDPPFVYLLRVNIEHEDGPGEAGILAYFTTPQDAGAASQVIVGQPLGAVRAMYGDRYEHVNGDDHALVTRCGIDRYSHELGPDLDWIASAPTPTQD